MVEIYFMILKYNLYFFNQNTVYHLVMQGGVILRRMGIETIILPLGCSLFAQLLLRTE